MCATTIRNPLNDRAIDLYSVGATEDGSSRFLRGVSPEGHSVDVHQAVFLAWDRLLADRREQTPPAPSATRTVRLKFAGRNERGEYVLVERGAVTGVPVFDGASLPTRFANVRTAGPGDLLDRFFLGESDGPWAKSRDPDVWNALLGFLEAEQPPASVVRYLNDRVAIALCLRAGLDVHPSELPNVGTPHP